MERPDAPLEVIVAGAGGRARAWAELLARSSAARVVALVARDASATLPGLAVPRFASIDEALAVFPHARVAAALPPRASLEAALALAASERRGLVEAPLSIALADVELPAGAAAVQVAHGWVTLGGASTLASALAERPAERVLIEARGLPEERGGDAEEVLIHALALALRWSPSARVERADQTAPARIEVTLRGADDASVVVVAHAEGQGVDVSVEGPSLALRWRADDRRETLSSRTGPPRDRAVQPGAVRALHQLVAPDEARGDDLPRAKRVAELARDVRRALGSGPALGGRPLRDAARIASARPSDLLAQLGLSGALPALAPAPTLRVPTPPEPLELWLYRAGRKPVAFLTARPEEAERVAACFDGAHVERRERRVHVGAQDAWIDRRDVGDARIELYVSRDPALAREAARLQVENDPSASLRELGRLMGYPPCCIDAFAAQSDRANNTQNRYATAARTRARERWPWELANLRTMLLPWYPCSYTCAVSLDLARSALGAMEAAHPGTVTAIRALLGRAVLYFDHERQIVLHGEATGDTVRYAGASVPEGADLGALGGAIAAGDELTFDDAHLVVRTSGREILRIARTDPGLGFLAPFSP